MIESPTPQDDCPDRPAAPVNAADLAARWPSRSEQARSHGDALRAAYRHGLASGLCIGMARGMQRGFFTGALATLVAVFVGLLVSGRLS